MKQTGVSIQGIEGSFHHMAVDAFFGTGTTVVPCHTFREVINYAQEQPSHTGVMAIENSIAGSILSNYNLLQKSSLRIIGEIYLEVKQNLLVNRGVQLHDIHEVHSHTMALQQCDLFLQQHQFKLVETEDTALSAKLIRQHHYKHIAAVASELAASIYDLDIIASSIQTEINNYTRFLVLKPGGSFDDVEDADKASVYFHTDHSKGSLAKVLAVIAAHDINLSKLQSSPIPGTPFRYAFHADMEFSERRMFDNAMHEVKTATSELKIYGVYKKGVLPVR